MQVSASLSAADVLAGNMAPNGTFQACKPGGVWGAPKARSGMMSAAAVKSATMGSKAEQPAFPSDSTENVATALLGLQGENTRMSHKQVEQHRRLKAKQYFDELRCLVPGGMDSKNDRNRVLQLAIDHLKAVLSGQATATPTIKEENAEKDEAARLSEEDTASEQLMFEMDGVDGRKLSHNEVEQRRRLQAKLLYEELRSLLPNAAKFDKNTVLLSCIHILKQKSGVTEEALSRMVEGLNSAEQEEGKAVPSARGGARGGAKVGSAEVKTEGRSVTSLAVTGKEWGGSSESPCDVVSFADMFSSSNNTANKNRRKRAAPCEELDSPSPQPNDAPSAPGSARGEEGVKRSRASSLEPSFSATLMSSEHAAAPASVFPAHLEPLAPQEEENSSSSTEAMDALALLSACAASEPDTPQITPFVTPHAGPVSCGASSLILALHPLSLSTGASMSS